MIMRRTISTGRNRDNIYTSTQQGSMEAIGFADFIPHCNYQSVGLSTVRDNYIDQYTDYCFMHCTNLSYKTTEFFRWKLCPYIVITKLLSRMTLIALVKHIQSKNEPGGMK